MEHAFNKIIDLLYLARQKGVEVLLNEERLQLKTGENVEIDEQLLSDIRSNKQSIIDYLSSDDWKALTVNGNRKKINAFDRNALTHIPASFSQERLWFIDHLGGSIEYHSPAILRLTGNLNKDALARSLQTVIERHEVLRTVFYEIDGQVYQSIKESINWQLEFVGGSDYSDNADELKLHIERLVKKPFDLAKDFPIRGTLISLNPQEYILAVTIHHIASDAWSTAILVNEVAELYNASVGGRTAKLTVLPLQYADFAVWQRAYLQGDILQKKITYWKNKLDGQQTLQLPADYTRSSAQNTYGASSSFKVDKQLLGKLHDLSQAEGVSLYMVLLAAFKVLLFRYSGQHDITVGTSIASRQQKELEGLIGFFVNTLALRDEINPDASFTALLQQVKATTLGAYEHQDIPFEKVVEVAVKDRDAERSPLFQVMLVLNNTPESSGLVLGDVELRGESFVTNISKFELTFFITESPNGLSGHVDYRKDLYAAATINGMLSHYINLLGSIVANPHQKVGLLPMLKDAEEQQLLQDFNSSEVAYPKDKTVVDLFEEQAAKNPTATAIVFEDEALAYQQLNERSNQLAHYLISRGVKPDTLVPLYMERSARMMVGMLGILKAGAAYVPIDTDFPADRISYMLQDAGAATVVSSSTVSGKLEVNSGVEIIEVDTLSNQSKENPGIKLLPHHLAYVIYTSGSTGRPKGVMIEHRHLVDYYFGLKKNIQIDECSSFALVSTIATDLGNTVIFGSVLSGGALHLFSKESVSNIEYLHRYFHEKEIDCVKIVPSHWKALRNGDTLLLPKKLLVFGGETLPWEVAEQIQNADAGCRIVNHYGPTETTIGKLLHEVQPGKIYDKTIPVGKPFSNTKVYVLSTEMQPCPIGVPGQLYISGDGVARGYYNNKTLTNEKFITDPFGNEAASGLKMYGTGDLVKWLADGNISFIGRVDDQVKIRGYRVEPGEVERTLQQSNLVSGAAVLAQKDKQGNNRLTAYIVPKETFDREGITDWLKEKLPEYMIPAMLIEIANIPLTANGKIDRKALPDPDATSVNNEYVAPRNDTEAKMAAIWADVLELDEVSIHADFFELGGHSLLAVRLISAIRKAFEVEMPIGDIFDFPTVALLSAQLPNQGSAVMLPSVEKIQHRPEHIPLSFSQERLWFIDRLEGSVQYHVPAVLRLKGKLNRAALGFALQAIVNRHEVLRTVIRAEEGQPSQYVKAKGEWELAITDGAVYREDENELQQQVASLISKPFDLATDDMFRAELICFAEDDHLLVAVLHHIASDGWSKFVLVKELVALYSSYNEKREVDLEELPVQYADYSLWQRKYLQGEVLDRKLRYWKEKLEGVEALHLQTDYPRPAVWSTRGSIRSFGVDKSLADQLQVFSQQHGVTLYMTLLSVFNVLLYRYTGQQDICVGTPVAGRQQPELEALIGFFVNTLALRTEVDGKATFTELLQQVKSTTLAAYEHQEVPFEKVVDAMVKERDMSRNPLFQVMLVLRNTPEVPELRLGEVKLSPEGYGHTTALFDIAFFITETPHGLHGLVEYSTALYNAETIDRLLNHYKELLAVVIQNPQQTIGLLPMLTSAEKHQLLVDFNDTKADYPKNKTVVDLFEEQALTAPEAVAVVFEKEQITYSALNAQATRLADHLRSKGVMEEMLVPICIERGIGMIAGILGILKAGAAFVPIDPAYPEERIQFILQDTGAQLIVSNQNSQAKLGDTSADIVAVDGDWEAVQHQPSQLENRFAKPGNLALVIYTSGSTGKPKGVMVEHGGLLNLLTYISGEIGFNAQSSFLSVTTYSFDICYTEFFTPLITGGKLIIVPRNTALDGFKLAESISHYSPTHMQGTPATWQLLLEAGWKSTEGINMLIAGEPVKEDLKEKLTKNGRLFNGYGPTETTIYSTVKELRHNEKVTIGRPVANTCIYIVSKDQQLCPVGVAGEICIAGDGLARGYLNRSDLTTEKFAPNPFSTVAGARLYKTGDLGKWLPDGNIECFGRIDSQVKVRGYRIELGEIETVMQQSGLVSIAVVLAKEDEAGFYSLTSYYVPDEELLKAKETGLYEEQVANWKQVYETEYAPAEKETDDEEFDIGIWNDSFTGNSIPREQMEEWVDDIIRVIMPEQAGEVLEIGCGTGLIYYRLAGTVKKYTGTDFSRSSINQISNRISKGVRNYGPTELQVAAAHEVSLPAGERVDTIILNSVIQYFPGEGYMSNVIGKCLHLLKDKGRIIIGDVRDNRLLELFKHRIQLQKLQGSAGIRELTWAVQQEMLNEEELCFSPEYFYHLQSLYPQITHVDIQWKQASYTNELSLYRYTVVLYVGGEQTVVMPQWQNWKEINQQNIISRLQQQVPVIAVKDMPNPRLWQERLLNKTLPLNSVSSAGDLLDAINKGDAEKEAIEEILETAQAAGYSCRLLLNEDPLLVNMLLELHASDHIFGQVYSEKKHTHKGSFTNVPLFSSISLLIQKDIRTMFQKRLPEYMIPSEFVALSKLPTTANGKTDRLFLNSIQKKGSGKSINYQAPETEVEKVIATIWQRLLHIDRIGVHDDFFESGGHSLLAMRVISAIRNELEVELVIRDLFKFSTISDLSKYVEIKLNTHPENTDPEEFDLLEL